MEQQAQILRSLLAQLEIQEAVDEQAAHGITGEFVASAMVMSDMPVPEDGTVCFTCCSHPTTPEEGVYCITSFKNKKHSVVVAAQMVRKAFSRLFGAARTGL